MLTPRFIKLFGYLSVVIVTSISYPVLSQADNRGYMGHMDDETMERMMEQRGYGGGYGGGYGYGGGRGYMGMMGPMGGMMGPMGGMMGPMGPMGPMMMGNLAGLDLTDKQREQIWEIQSKMRTQHFDLMEKMMNTSDQLYKLYDTEKPDAVKIGKVYDEIFKIKREMIQEHIEIRNKIYDLLTKEQREKFRSNDPFANRFGMMMF